MSRTLKIMFAAAAVLAMAAGVCCAQGYTRYSHGGNSSLKSINSLGDLFKFGCRFSLEFGAYRAQLGHEIQTTPVHPDDSGFLSGETSTQPDKYDNFELEPRLDGLLAVDMGAVRPFCGVGLRISMLGLLADNYQQGFYSVKQQESDSRPGSSGSFVYTRLEPGTFIVAPLLGVEVRAGDNSVLMFSLEFPYTDWSASSGHDRWGYWEQAKHDSWKGSGIRYSLGYLFNIDQDFGGFMIQAFYEEYEPVFLLESAKIEQVGLALGCAL